MSDSVRTLWLRMCCEASTTWYMTDSAERSLASVGGQRSWRIWEIPSIQCDVSEYRRCPGRGRGANCGRYLLYLVAIFELACRGN